MSDMLNYVSDYNVYNTRNVINNDLYVPKPRIDMFRQSFQYTGPTYYNNLPDNVKNCTSLNDFKNELKEFISS